jgi:hypothetical protein
VRTSNCDEVEITLLFSFSFPSQEEKLRERGKKYREREKGEKLNLS